MTGIILAGGEGVRLRPLTYVRPKPMAPIANKPLLEYHVELFRSHGIEDIIFCVRGDIKDIEEYFGDGSKFGVQITYSIENEPLGTAGAIGLAEPHVKSETAVVMNGDNLIDFDLSAALKYHLEKGTDATIGLVNVPAPTPCGIISTDLEGWITAFEEPSEDVKRNLSRGDIEKDGTVTVNSGVYVMSHKTIRMIPFGKRASIEKEFFPSLITSDCLLAGFVMHGYWQDIGNPGNYLQAHRDILSGKANLPISGIRSAGGYCMGHNVVVHPSAQVSPHAHLGDECSIGANTHIEGFTSIGKGCTIGEECLLEDSVLLDQVTVENSCVLRNCIVDYKSSIGSKIHLSERSVIGANSSIYL